MTREEEIRNAIDTILPIPPSEKGRKYEQALMATGFEAGVKWADKNPKSSWINVEDDLPCNHVELLVDCFQTKYVEACFTHPDGSSFVTIEKMVRVDVGIGKDCWVWSSNLREHVTYWKPIPEPPKEQEIKL